MMRVYVTVTTESQQKKIWMIYFRSQVGRRRVKIVQYGCLHNSLILSILWSEFTATMHQLLQIFLLYNNLIYIHSWAMKGIKYSPKCLKCVCMAMIDPGL